jgi:hypothetical protein
LSGCVFVPPLRGAGSREQRRGTRVRGERGAAPPRPHSRGPPPRESLARHNSTARTNPTSGAQLEVVEPTPCRVHRGSSHHPPHHSTPLRLSKIRPCPGPKPAQDELAVVARRQAAPDPRRPRSYRILCPCRPKLHPTPRRRWPKSNMVAPE